MLVQLNLICSFIHKFLIDHLIFAFKFIVLVSQQYSTKLLTSADGRLCSLLSLSLYGDNLKLTKANSSCDANFPSTSLKSGSMNSKVGSSLGQLAIPT